MEYTVKHCPNCNGELHIPEDMKTCICSYCGETFELKKETVSIMPESYEQVETDYQNALNNISVLIEDYERKMKKFKKSAYGTCFEEYTNLGKSFFEPVERFYSLSEENMEKVPVQTAQALIDAIDKSIVEKTQKGVGKISKGAYRAEYRFFLAIYTVPMINSLGYCISNPLASKIVDRWNELNPKFTFLMAKYEDINQGFNKLPFCFITTAVCEQMDKKDDCYELTAFRKFRDTYMKASNEGKKLVDEYYEIAPAIVFFTNMQPDRNERYKAIWQEYLQPCLKDIEANQLESCEERYVNMVQNLKSEYHID